MPTSREQSAIAEVRDQLSLDYADGTRLNAIGGNYGLPRPVFGYTDDMWRALVKELAVEKKQIRLKFHEVLATLFGPQITECATLKAACSVGESTIFLNNTDRLPQLGTLKIDPGLATEETHRYSYIDRETGEVFLESVLAFDHAVITEDAEQPLLVDYASGDTAIYVPFSAYFPTTGFPVALVMGRRLGTDQYCSLSANDTDTGILTIAGVTPEFGAMTPCVIQTALSAAYPQHSTYLTVQSSVQLPSAGVVLLGPTSNSFTVSALGTTTTVPVAPGTFTASRLTSYRVVFDGNVTAALAGVEARIIGNTAILITTKEILPAAPAAGDTFSIRPVVEYTYNDADTNALTLRRELPDEIELAALTTVELLDTVTTVTLAQVVVEGTGWDVYQVDPRHVEIYIPDDIQDEGNLRNAAYLHTAYDASTPSTTVDVAASAGDTDVLVASTATFPVAGVVTLDSGGANEERVFYVLPFEDDEVVSIVAVTVSGGTRSVVTLLNGGLTASTLIGRHLFLFEKGYEILDNAAGTITLVEVLSNTVIAEAPGAVVRFFSGDSISVPSTVTNAHLVGETVDLYQPNVGDLLDGNLYTTPDTFAGPYIYKVGERVGTPTSGASTTITEAFAAPTTVVTECFVGDTALEVEDASTFPLSGFPYDAILGRDTGNRETTVINSVSLKQRTGTTVLAPSAAGVNVSLSCVDVAGTGAADAFPNVTPYRVRLGRGTVNHEICTVTSVDVGSDTIVLFRALNPHAAGELVELCADVLGVDTLNDDHRGYIDASQFNTLWPSIESTQRLQAETVEVLYDSVAVTDVTDFPESGYVIVNLNSQRMSAKSKVATAMGVGDVALPLDSTDSFPPASACPYKVRLGKGKFTEEIVTVTGNNTVFDSLTLSHGVKHTHAVGEVVEFLTGQPEVLEYTSVGPGNVLNFSTSFVVESDHHIGETVDLSLATSEPDILGYDFSFRMPPDVYFRIRFLFDLIRAAGIRVSVIDKR